jgi:hypothetical protein
VSIHAPLRLLIAATALLIAAAIAASSAHALLLGDAVVRSAPGAPLRAVIPLKPSPGEVLDAACFRLAASAEGAPPVTTRVSLERAAATPRLVVTTDIAVADPAVRFAIEAGCEGVVRRNYALQVDTRSPAAQANLITTAYETREPAQERTEAPSSEKVSAEPPRPKNRAANPASRGAIASATSLPRTAPSDPELPADNPSRLGWYLGAPIGMGALALGVLFVTRRRTPELPDWTRGGPYTGPRSRTDMSAPPVMLSHDELTPMPKVTTRQRTDGASLGVVKPGIAANSLRASATEDISSLDTLINDVAEADRLEERAVREAWAAARSAVEQEEDNAVLRAIDQAERELLFVAAQPSEAAMDRSLEDDLLSAQRPSDKAAA